MRGPANFSSNDSWGLLIDNFDSPPKLMMPYNHPYYPELLEKYGLKKIKDLYAYRLNADRDIIPERILKVTKYIESRNNIIIRTINMKNFQEEINIIKKIYNGAWEKNWGFVPMTDEEFNHLAKDLKAAVEPKLVLIAEVNGEPAGFSLCLPDIHEALIKINGKLLPFGIFKLLYHIKNIKTLRLITLGVTDKFRNKGIETVFFTKTLTTAENLGYKWGELSWILEDNHLIRKGIEAMGAKIYKTYRLFDKNI